jgi:hypothetical protein
MSWVVKFVVYYGPGIVQTSETRVDLSQFQCGELELLSSETVSIS